MSMDKDPFDPNVDLWNECAERSAGEEAEPRSLADVLETPPKVAKENEAFLAKRAGAAGWVPKPINAFQLRDLIAEVVGAGVES